VRLLGEKCRLVSIRCYRAKYAIGKFEHHSDGCLANRDGVPQHDLKYRLQLAGRRADYLQHFRSCRLLFERLGKFARARLLGLEQAHILNCDDGLFGERLQQFFLSLWDSTGPGPTNDDDANWFALAQHRHAQQSPPAHRPRKSFVVIRIGKHILQANN
jgi:hypothetical protein